MAFADSSTRRTTSSPALSIRPASADVRHVTSINRPGTGYVIVSSNMQFERGHSARSAGRAIEVMGAGMRSPIHRIVVEAGASALQDRVRPTAEGWQVAGLPRLYPRLLGQITRWPHCEKFQRKVVCANEHARYCWRAMWSRLCLILAGIG